LNSPRCSIIIPARNEHNSITPVLLRIAEGVTLPFECLVIVDDEDDLTVGVVGDIGAEDPRFKTVVNEPAGGPAAAIKTGILESTAPVVVVTMADGSDDPRSIDDLVRLVERGVVVAAASRYMAGGQQVGAPLFKSLLSRLAGLSLYWFARVGTHDATNSFKAYDRSFLEAVGVDSTQGFEMGLELVAKARRARLPVAEVPTIWLERTAGTSQFRVWKWIPRYLRWYLLSYTRSRISPMTSTDL
jgi:glycosyltransferase involved in cell wall biosynthesis|tara:strand:+ start:880 stop:1611 length:732 start_codon:yes stop_codon:yes gene_type:complete